MMLHRADLHIHTCLSPCAELEMTPVNIVRKAVQAGLNVIGICDHNSCENVPYVRKSADRESLIVIGGMEITSSEEVHILAFFDKEEELFSLQEIIYSNLHGVNNETLYGEQVIVNEKDEVLGFSSKLLIGATELTLEKIVQYVHRLNGIAIPSHVDRKSFSIISQLGFIPEGLQVDALELSSREKASCCESSLPVVAFSDAHRLDRIGLVATGFFTDHFCIEEMRKAFNGEDGRKVML